MRFKQILTIFAFVVFLIYAVPLVSGFYFFSFDKFFATIVSARTIYSIKLSIFAASVAALGSSILALPAGYALSRYNFFGKKIIDLFLELPVMISPAALGALLLIFFGNPAGQKIQSLGIDFVYTIAGVVVAQFVTTLGIATRLTKSTIDQLPRRYEDVARSLGASPVKAFLTVTLPLSKRGILASFILTWAKAFGEFGATITIAGTMAMKTETIPVSIYMKLSNADIEGATVLIMILVSIGTSILYLARIISKKTPYA